MATKFYKCRHCGNVVEKVVDSGIKVVCCGELLSNHGNQRVAIYVEGVFCYYPYFIHYCFGRSSRASLHFINRI